jgi:hypothetical protein
VRARGSPMRAGRGSYGGGGRSGVMRVSERRVTSDESDDPRCQFRTRGRERDSGAGG